ncbi:MAG: DUF4291 domain-containing protein [Lachnospiraceae bacterium]
MNEHKIRAVYNNETIRVYQAYNAAIAEQAIAKGTFGSYFKLDRMTWIKPSFLWMMYRCGWAQKIGQERVLAIDIKRDAFDFLVNNAMYAKYEPQSNLSKEEWKEQIKKTDIRIQWDPERDIYGNPLEYRSIQLGIRGKYVQQYVNNWIVKIKDITEYVTTLKEKIDIGCDVTLELPKEKEYRIKYNEIDNKEL